MRPIPLIDFRSFGSNPFARLASLKSIGTRVVSYPPVGARSSARATDATHFITIDQCLRYGRVNDAASDCSTAPFAYVLLDSEFRKAHRTAVPAVIPASDFHNLEPMGT